MESIGKKFNFISKNGHVTKLPFRVGDFVTIKDWGGQYDTYTGAFVHFYGDTARPYYSHRDNQKKEILGKRKFRVTAVAEHESLTSDVLCYLRDVTGAGCIMDGHYLTPVRVLPLRPGESYEIKLDKIKRIR